MRVVYLLPLLCLASPADAGDPAAGAVLFQKCKACHAIVAPDGTELQKGGKIGPNLFGIIARPVAGLPDFKYSDGAKAAGANGMIWDEAMLAAFVIDPSAWLQNQTGDAAARSRMTLKLGAGGADVAAYLATLVHSN